MFVKLETLALQGRDTIQQLKTVKSNHDLFGTHHALYIPNVKDSFFYIVTILHPEIIQSIDRVIINFLKSHEVL